MNFRQQSFSNLWREAWRENNESVSAAASMKAYRYAAK
jgi:hypothetical protein